MLRSLLLYTALVLGANTATAKDVDWEALSVGEMSKLAPAEEAPALPDTTFTDPDGKEYSFADYEGKVILVNFWATWCAPCREEMPSLDALQSEFGGDDFEVVTIATGRNPPEKIDKFFEETGVENLPVLLDPKQKLARDMGVVGLPVSVIIDREGNEIARLIGDADWASDEAKEVIRQLTAP